MGEETRTSAGPAAQPAGDSQDKQECEPTAPSREVPCEPPRARVRCPVCGGSGMEAPPGAGAGHVRCEGCGTWFLKMRPSLGQLEREREALFEGAFALPHHEARREAREQAYEVMGGYFKIKKGRAVPLNAFERYVLDVGCGPGFRLKSFVSYGWIEGGSETSSTAYEYAKRQPLDVKHGWFTQVGFGDTRFDLALFAGNFGELPDPFRAVERLHEFLKPGGLVCVLREPLASDDAGPPAGGPRLFLFPAHALRRLFCRNRFSFVSEELDGGAGTFWFQTRLRG